MRTRSFLTFSIAALSATAAAAADLLPLRNGIYVPTNVACKGASNAEMVNYWGGKSGIGVAQASCTIKSISHKANIYTFKDECRDDQTNSLIEGGGATVLTVTSPTRFTMHGTRYRYCGLRPQW